MRGNIRQTSWRSRFLREAWRIISVGSGPSDSASRKSQSPHQSKSHYSMQGTHDNVCRKLVSSATSAESSCSLALAAGFLAGDSSSACSSCSAHEVDKQLILSRYEQRCSCAGCFRRSPAFAQRGAGQPCRPQSRTHVTHAKCKHGTTDFLHLLSAADDLELGLYLLLQLRALGLPRLHTIR